jgi:hypothetical protein
MARPAVCWGAANHKHKPGCRKGRPLCRWRRASPCTCPAYHYPHRNGSGRCGDPVKMDAWVHGPAEVAA